MATNWGAIGISSLGQTASYGESVSILLGGGPVQVLPVGVSCIVCGGDQNSTYALGGEDLVIGNPSPPSLRMDSGGRWRFRWSVNAGNRTIACSVQQYALQNSSVAIAPWPTMVIKANAAIGVVSDVIVTLAAQPTTWTTLGPQTVSVSANGALWVELRNNAAYVQPGGAPCWFDNIVVT